MPRPARRLQPGLGRVNDGLRALHARCSPGQTRPPPRYTLRGGVGVVGAIAVFAIRGRVLGCSRQICPGDRTQPQPRRWCAVQARVSADVWT